ncbi:MAG: carbonic anhydrase [Rhodospirillales bacterium]|jgi:carbonic anhydrase|nr:carbonic anhydrase [Rhodospirillales bacterium]
MDSLIAGYRRFRADLWPRRRQLLEQLAEHGQHPRAMVIACADSRVDPAMIFDAAPGEIFVIRNVANLVPPCQPDGAYHGTSAALEFGVVSLGVRDLIVMGHGQCGGVQALLAGIEDTPDGFIAPWMRLAEPARARTLACQPADPQLVCEQETVRLSLDNLRSFPWIRERVADRRLRLHGAHYAIRTGILALLGADGRFAPVA